MADRVRQACLRGAPQGSWLALMLSRKPKMLVTVALANKIAGIRVPIARVRWGPVWALLVKGGTYMAPAPAA